MILPFPVLPPFMPGHNLFFFFPKKNWWIEKVLYLCTPQMREPLRQAGLITTIFEGIGKPKK
jgi:hypothetical protein